MAFAKELRKRRLIAEISQQELAEALGLKQGAVSSYENGNSKPTFEGLMRICSILQCTPNDLTADELAAAQLLANP